MAVPNESKGVVIMANLYVKRFDTLEIKWPAEFKVEPQFFPFILAFQDMSHTTVVVAWALKRWLEGE